MCDAVSCQYCGVYPVIQGQPIIVDGNIEDCYFGNNDSPDVKYWGDYEAMKASYFEHIIMNMIIFPDLVTERPSTFY